MSCDPIDVVVGATRRELRIIFVNEQGIPIDVSGGSVWLQGTSEDLPGVELNVAGTVYADPVRGPVGRWTQLGGTTYVTLTMLGPKSEATFDMEAKYRDTLGLDDWTPTFKVRWRKPPVAQS